MLLTSGRDCGFSLPLLWLLLTDVVGSIVSPSGVYHPRRGNPIVFESEISGLISNLEKGPLNISISNAMGKE